MTISTHIKWHWAGSFSVGAGIPLLIGFVHSCHYRDLPKWLPIPGQSFLNNYDHLYILIALSSILLFFIELVRLISLKKARATALPHLLGCLLAIISIYYCKVMITQNREMCWERITNNGKQLIEAIEKYKSVKAAYPSELEDLIPEYMPQTPKTGCRGCHPYEYGVSDKEERFELRAVIRWEYPGVEILFYNSITTECKSESDKDRVGCINEWTIYVNS